MTTILELETLVAMDADEFPSRITLTSVIYLGSDQFSLEGEKSQREGIVD